MEKLKEKLKKDKEAYKRNLKKKNEEREIKRLDRKNRKTKVEAENDLVQLEAANGDSAPKKLKSVIRVCSEIQNIQEDKVVDLTKTIVERKKSDSEVTAVVNCNIENKVKSKSTKAVSSKKKAQSKDGEKYRKIRCKATERNRKYRENMTEEKKEMQRAKDRERYWIKKQCGQIKSIAECTKKEIKQQRKKWTQQKRIQRLRKKYVTTIVCLTPPGSIDGDLNETPRSLQRQRGRKQIRRDRATCYRDLHLAHKKIQDLKRQNERYRKQAQRAKQKFTNRTQASNKTPSPTTKVKRLLAERVVPEDVKQKLVFHEALMSEMRHTKKALKDDKEKQAFDKILSGSVFKKYRVQNLANEIVPVKQQQKFRHRKFRILQYDIINFYKEKFSKITC